VSANEALVERVRRRLAREGWAATAVSVTDALRAEGLVLPESSIVEVVRALRTELAGLGVLEVLVAADGVTDVLVNGPDQVWVDAGEGLTRTDVRFPDEGAVRRLAQRLAGSVGRRLDDSVPYVDARLPTGIRLHAVLPPISGQGTCISLRVPRRRVFTLADLAEVAMVPPDGVEILAGLVARRAAFLVSGGTGQWQDHAAQQLAVRGRPPPSDWWWSRTQRNCSPHIRTSCGWRRVRPTPRGPVRCRFATSSGRLCGCARIGLWWGRCAGAEVVDLLSALNTGHEGGCGTVHANSAADVPARLESLALPAGMTRAGTARPSRRRATGVVHLVRDPQRRVAGIAVLQAGDDGLVTSVPAVVFRDGRTLRGPAAGVLL
jgi:pilus assembly protein CpaF